MTLQLYAIIVLALAVIALEAFATWALNRENKK